MFDSYSDPFFLQTTDLTLKGPLFTETTKTTKAKSGQQKLRAKGPPFIFFYFFNVTYKTGRDLRVPISIFFRRYEIFSKFFCLQSFPPSILLKSPLVISEVKRYIQKF